jgi:hypothetical protein
LTAERGSLDFGRSEFASTDPESLAEVAIHGLAFESSIARGEHAEPAPSSLVRRAAETTERLARTFFGARTYVRQVPHVDRETREPVTILEVHPQCEAHTDPKWLTAQHRAFMDAFVRSVPSSQRTHLVITVVPTDADPA